MNYRGYEIEIKNHNVFYCDYNKHDEVIQELKKLEENLIKQVLVIVLNREPTIDDLQKCSKFIHPNDKDRYQLSYENVFLGYITIEDLTVKFILR